MNNENENVLPFPCKFPQDVCLRSPEIAAHEQAILNLREWEERQNGTLDRVEQKIDKLNERVEDKISGLRVWFIGVLLALSTIGATLGLGVMKLFSDFSPK